VSIEILTLLFFGSLLFFLLLGLPLAFVLGGVSVVFLYFTWGFDSFYMVSSQIWGTMESFTLVAIPLFVFMAMILERTGVAKDLYRMMHLWCGGLRGGLAIGTLASAPFLQPWSASVARRSSPWAPSHCRRCLSGAMTRRWPWV